MTARPPYLLTRAELDTLDAEEIILPTVDGNEIAILNVDASRAEHILDRARALAYARRILALLAEMDEPRTLVRPAAVDDQLREMDD